MTVQACDQIKIEGNWHSLEETPLKSLLDHISEASLFTSCSSANWRGYIAKWEVIYNQLFLVSLNGELNQKAVAVLDAEQRALLDDLLNSESRPVFAGWFSGQLRSPKGSWLEIADSVWDTMSEFTIFLEVKDGEIVRRWEVDNRTAHAEQESQKDIQKRSLVGIIYDFGENELTRAREAITDPISSAMERMSQDESLKLIVLEAKLRMKSGSMRRTSLRRAIYDLTRDYFDHQVSDRTPLSLSDCSARRKFDAAIKALERSLAAHIKVRTYLEHLPDPDGSFTDALQFASMFPSGDAKEAAELTRRCRVPKSDEDRLKWAVTALRSAERHIEREEFALLGIALEAVEHSVDE